MKKWDKWDKKVKIIIEGLHARTSPIKLIMLCFGQHSKLLFSLVHALLLRSRQRKVRINPG